ncbi:MAG: TetR/AcrR family transcriptional regulator, partial [Prevotella sp.]|nr:TetR/AcrR family transcriptional regulator [Prevotella sp.]
IHESAPIFNTKGYESTSLSDIQEVTKLTKGAIYGNFSDKNELAIAAFNHSCSLIIGRINEVMTNSSTAGEALIAYANYYVKNWQVIFNVGGCPMLNAAVEADDHLSYLREYVRRNMKRFIGLLKSTIEQGQRNNEFAEKVDAEEYAAIIYSIVEGNILLAKIMDDPKYFQIAVDRIKRIVDQELSM